MRFMAVFFLSLVLFGGGSFAAGADAPSAAGTDTAAAASTAKDLCDTLLTSMKKGASLDFAARRDLLAPRIQNDFDFAFMTRIVSGPVWQGLGADERKKLVAAFSDYSIATYAQEFSRYSGERFEVDPAPVSLADGDCVVHTKLFTGNQTVELDYRLRKTGDHWRIIDVYLNGTISQLAARRSEYSTVLQQGGAPALIDLLNKKTAELGNQRPGSAS